MNIKETIKALLKSDFGGVQLSAARVDELAKRMDGKVESEDDVKAKLDAFNELLPFTDIAKEDDRARTAQAELEKLKAKKPEKAEEKKDEEPAPADEVPSWAKALIDGNKALQDTVQALKGEKVVTDRRSAILAKLKGADEAYSNKVLRDFGRMSFPDDASFEEYLGEVESDYTDYAQSQADSKLGKDAPFLSVGSDGKVKEATEAEVTELFGDIKI